MKRLFVTDIHLGHRYLPSKRLTELISVMNQGWEQIVLGGDIIDLWLRPDQDVLKHPDVIRFADAVKKLVASGVYVVYVKGNHDEDIGKYNWLLHPVSSYSFTENGREFLFEHGHQYDPLNFGRFAFIGRVATAFEGVLHLMNLSARKLLSKDWSFAFEANKRERADHFNAVVKKNRGRCNVFIYGHTHRQRVDNLKNLTVVNCGDILDDGTYVSLIDGQVRLHKLNT